MSVYFQEGIVQAGTDGLIMLRNPPETHCGRALQAQIHKVTCKDVAASPERAIGKL